MKRMHKIYRTQRQHGLSMIELMVALVIGLILTAAIVQMFVGSRVTYSMQSELAKLQENARFAIEYISKDLRSAGYMGCKQFTSGTVKNVLNDHETSPYSGDEWMDFLVFTDGGDAADVDDLPPSDQINVKYLDTAAACMIDMDKTTAEYFHCSNEHTFTKGEILAASDCRHMAIFQMSNTNNNANSLPINHNTGGGAVPGNCTKGLAPKSSCSDTNGVEYDDWKSNTRIQRFLSYRYFVQNNDFNPPQPALYRSSLSTTDTSIGMTGQELVEGVENMQILLGFDTNGDDNADCYSNIPANCNSSIDEAVSARVSLLMRSIEANITPDNQTYVFNGKTYTATDGRLRKVFTATVTLRNLLI